MIIRRKVVSQSRFNNMFNNFNDVLRSNFHILSPRYQQCHQQLEAQKTLSHCKVLTVPFYAKSFMTSCSLATNQISTRSTKSRQSGRLSTLSQFCHCFVSILPKVCRCRFVRQVSNNNLYLWRRRFDYFAQSPIRQLVTVDIVAKVEHVQLRQFFSKVGDFCRQNVPEC